ncbi:MAG: sugar ABC transporter ATP-binding protein [Chloroflexota bacterium]
MNQSPSPLLEMRSIVKAFYGVRVLHEVSFDLHPGEVHVLLGENGAGKSTLMKILSAAYRADGGEIRIDGEPVRFTHPTDARDAGISTIYQHFSQAAHLSIAENLFLGNFPRTRLGLVDWRRMYRDAEALLERVGAELNPRTPVQKLSVASRQQVEIAAALGRKARILVMDEPTASLTEREVDRLFQLINSLKQQGVGIVYISHRLEELKRVGDRVTVLRDGHQIDTLPIDDADFDTLVRMMIGRDLNQIDVGEPVLNAPEMLRVENLSREGHFNNVNFTLHQGEILGITGLVGAGRTEVAEAIFGVHPPDSGTITIRGEPVHIRHPREALSQGIGFLTEDRGTSGLCMSMGIRENMTLPYWASGKSGLSGLLLNMRDERKKTDHYARQLNVRAANLNTPVKFLSGGNQQKVVLAKWLLPQTSILIVDEPTAGVDIGAKEEVHRMLIAFAREQGGAVLVISSDLPEVLQLSDRILVMARGDLVGELSRAEATEEQIMNYALQLSGDTAP